MTNADKIRSMTDGELADALSGIMTCDLCRDVTGDKCDHEKDACSKHMAEFLQEKVKE